MFSLNRIFLVHLFCFYPRDVEQLLRNRSNSSKKGPSIETRTAGTANGDSTGFIYNNKDSQNNKGKLSLAHESTSGSQNGLSNARGVGREGLDQLIDSLDETYVDPSSGEEEQLESSEGYIGDEEYLIVDFAKGNTSKGSLGGSNSGAAIMDDEVYNKDGRRRRRKTLEERDKKKITEDVQPERLSLRRRLKDRQQGVTGGGADGGERERQEKGSNQRREPRKNVIDQEEEDSYDETSRRRRRRSAGREGTRPPANDSSSRRSEESRASETTATLSKATTSESDSRPNKETKSRVMDQVHLSENRPLDADGSTEVDGSDEENSKGVGLFSRLEALRRENDSSGSETGKKKKLVLKRGSMRRKRLQEENAKSESENDSDNSKQKVDENKTKKEVTVAKESSIDSKNRDIIDSKIINVEDVCVTESVVDAPNVAPGFEQTKNSGYLQKEVQVQGTVKGSKVQQFSVSSACKDSQMTDLATGLGNLDVVDEREVVSVDIGHTESNMTEHKECAKNVDLQPEDNGKEIEVKKEKKRKLVLKVKRKKNKKSAVNNELNDKVAEAPVMSRDKDPRVHSIKKNGEDNDNREVQVQQNGEKTVGEPIKVETEGPSVKDLLRRMEARGKQDNELIRNGMRNGRHETDHIKTKKLDLEKFEKQGDSNGAVMEKELEKQVVSNNPFKTLELEKFEKQANTNGTVRKLALEKFERQGDSNVAVKKLELEKFEKQGDSNGSVKRLESENQRVSNSPFKALELEKFEKQGSNNGTIEKVESEKEGGSNGPVKTLELENNGGDNGLVGNGKLGKGLELASKGDLNENGDDSGKPKKKKFVLKRKKKGTN